MGIDGSGPAPEEIGLKSQAADRHLPGGPDSMRPIEINGTFYDPLEPPKLFRTPDGQDEWVGGKEIDRDEAYSQMFWRNQPEGMKEAMTENIETGLKNGFMAIFVTATKQPNGRFELEHEPKKRLSAYRVLARKLGYVIDSYKYNENAGNVTAMITKL